MELRDYQKRACRSMYDYIMGPSNKPVLASLPTASGKTLILSMVAKYVGRRAIMLVPNKELVQQNYDTAIREGVEGVGIYSASAGRKEIGEYLTIATIGSIKGLGKEIKEMGIDLVFIDECHIGTSWAGSGKKGNMGMFKKFMKDLRPKKVIGLSGTIYRLHSTMSGSKLVILNRLRPAYFKEIIHVTQISELTSAGYWTPISYETHEFDESGLKLNSTGAEFDEDSVRQAIDTQGINNNVCLRILGLLAAGKKSMLVFVDSVENAKKFQEYFGDEVSACVHAKTKKKDRTQMIQDFKDGKISIMFNVKVLTTGFDFPGLEVVIHGYPTNSMSLYTQIIGRGVRIFEGKKSFLYIDYCNNVDRFGKVEEQELINYPGNGWSIFSGNGTLITGVYLNGGYSLTKEGIDRREQRKADGADSIIVWFGKYKGQAIVNVYKDNPGYLTFMLEKFAFTGPKMKALKKEMIHILQSET